MAKLALRTRGIFQRHCWEDAEFLLQLDPPIECLKEVRIDGSRNKLVCSYAHWKLEWGGGAPILKCSGTPYSKMFQGQFGTWKPHSKFQSGGLSCYLHIVSCLHHRNYTYYMLYAVWPRGTFAFPLPRRHKTCRSLGLGLHGIFLDLGPCIASIVEKLYIHPICKFPDLLDQELIDIMDRLKIPAESFGEGLSDNWNLNPMGEVVIINNYPMSRMVSPWSRGGFMLAAFAWFLCKLSNIFF